MIEGASWRHEQSTRLAVTAAWATANFSRKKRLPKLADVLPGGEKGAPARAKRGGRWAARSIREQVFVLQALQAVCGGELRYGGTDRRTPR